MKTPYTALGLDPTKKLTQIHIRDAYRILCMEHHPDRPHNQGNPEAHEQFLVIQAAYDLLSDPIQRAAYDANPYPFPQDPQDQALMTSKDAALENEARDLISAIFNRYVEKLDARSAKNFDIQKNMRRELNEGVKQMKHQQHICRTISLKFNVIRYRLSKTPYLHEVLRGKRVANARSWSSARWQIMIAKRALDILFEMEYQMDPEPVNPFGSSTTNYQIHGSVHQSPHITFT
jgi:curved DNA-binding protein CbpA